MSLSNPAVTLYSPEGKCQQTYASVPAPAPYYLAKPFLMLLNNSRIIACGGVLQQSCYSYTISNNSWSTLLSTSSYPHDTNVRPIVFEGNIYFPDNKYPEIYNPTLNVWSTWPAPSTSLIPNMDNGCMVTWNNTLILFVDTYMLKYIISSRSWVALPYSGAPMLFYGAGCAVLPNQNILITGSAGSTYSKYFAVYNVTSNSWPYKTVGLNDMHTSFIMGFGNRVFVFSSYGMQEYHTTNNSFTDIGYNIVLDFPNVVVVPAKLFSNLPGGCVGVM